MSQDKVNLKLDANIPYSVMLNFDTPKTGNNDYGDWFLYGVTHDGEEKNLFATEYLHSFLQKYGSGDNVQITKNTKSGKTKWEVAKTGTSNGNGRMPNFQIDGRVRDIHKQVCLKLAIESLGVVKTDKDEYYEAVATRVDKFLEILEGKAESVVEKIKEEFDGEEIPF